MALARMAYSRSSTSRSGMYSRLGFGIPSQLTTANHPPVLTTVPVAMRGVRYPFRSTRSPISRVGGMKRSSKKRVLSWYF